MIKYLIVKQILLHLLLHLLAILQEIEFILLILNYIKVYVYGHTSNYIGDLHIKIRGILNPTNYGQSGNFYVRTYDGLNSKIIQRNYRNLDPFSFYYSYPGNFYNKIYL